MPRNPLLALSSSPIAVRFRILDWTVSTSRDAHRRINKQSDWLAIFVRRISNVIIRDEVSE